MNRYSLGKKVTIKKEGKGAFCNRYINDLQEALRRGKEDKKIFLFVFFCFLFFLNTGRLQKLISYQI